MGKKAIGGDGWRWARMAAVCAGYWPPFYQRGAHDLHVGELMRDA
jgi:hypothetical protein